MKIAVTLAAIATMPQIGCCPPCKVLEPRLKRWAAQHKDRLPVYRVDIDRDMPVANHFAVQTIPTVLLLLYGKEIGSTG